jgi:hypothetical protein
MTILNDTLELTVERGGVSYSFTKKNTTLVRNGNWITIRDFTSSPITFLFSEVTAPSSGSAVALLNTLRAYLQS